MPSAPQAVVELIERFAHNIEYYHRPDYNETQARREFIDPFFMALGWDVDNRKGVAPRYQEVIHEASLREKEAVRAPDYCFRVGPERKFFVEAKKPAVDIVSDIHPAYQLRRYAWTAKLPLSILTDFEGFSVYECQIPPKPSDKAATARLMHVRFTEYPERWEEIAAIFSREAVWRGDYDRYAETTKGKRGTQQVDDVFLQEIEKWRELLARNLALRNPSLTVRALNHAVQQTIDRIIFLRICEDRGIELYEQLKNTLNGSGVYPRLMDLFRLADDRYNSGLFHFRVERGREDPDTLTPELRVDDKVLAEIIGSLYYPGCPYAFDVLGVDILGNVYERFLGSVIRLTAGHQAKVEQKPEVRKAGGVYYTPKYIVDYIVKNTVGELCEGKTPGQISKLRILDPACGSGSFLLGAYQYLLDYHLNWYVEHPTKQARKELYQGRGGDWFLTTEEKKRILLNNIYGVDIDPQAVEVTKLSLLLKVLEGENQETLAQQLEMFRERALPDLASNIKCGNSLIGPDFYEGRQLGLLDEEETYRINAFDWDKEFREIMCEGGFDAVIGNPPYIRIQTLKEWAPKEVEFYKQRYVAASKGNYDIYVVFVEKGLRLLNQRGRLGYILPSKFFATDYGESLRRLITEREALSMVVDFGHSQVFDSATTYTCLLFLSGAPSPFVAYARTNDSRELAVGAVAFEQIDSKAFSSQSWSFASGTETRIADKLFVNSLPLGELPARIGRGSSSGADGVFMLRQEDCQLLTREGQPVEIEAEILRIPVYATDFGRYRFEPKSHEVIIYPYTVATHGYELKAESEMKQRFPKAYEYLLSRKKQLEARKQFKMWYGFSAPRNLAVHDTAQMLVPLLANTGLYCRLPSNATNFCLMASGGFSITIDPSSQISPNYVLGLLNSTLLFWHLRKISNIFRGGWITCTKQYVETLPIRSINFSDPADVARHDQMVALVERMLDLHKRLATTQLPQEKTLLQRQVAATDQQIDRLVYELYGLTEEEIGIVESTPC